MAEKKTILVVDDEKDVVDSLYDTFMDDYIVKTATSGAAALEILAVEDVALIISDQRMPEMEGTELFTRVNAIRPICKKILLTGYADINAAISAINKGSVHRYFGKPWDDNELRQAVDALLDDYEADKFIMRMTQSVNKLKNDARSSGDKSTLLGRFLNSLLLGAMIVDEAGAIQHVNEKGLRILGCPSLKEAMDKGLRDFFPLSDALCKAFYTKHQQGDTSLDISQLKSFDGEDVAVRIRVLFDPECADMKTIGVIFQRV